MCCGLCTILVGRHILSTSTPLYLRRLIQDRQHSHNLRSATTTLCQPFTTTTFAKLAFRCSASAVWSSLPKTVFNSDSVAVFKSRLNTFLFPGFLFFLCSLTRCLAPAPLELRPYGAIQMCLLLLLLLDRCALMSDGPRAQPPSGV